MGRLGIALMAKKPSITNEARAKLMLKLKEYCKQHPDGCTVTKLSQNLGWRKRETTKTVNDLVSSGMIYGDYLSPWVRAHPIRTLSANIAYLLKVSPWGEEFLKHWEELNKLSTARDHYYSEMEC